MVIFREEQVEGVAASLEYDPGAQLTEEADRTKIDPDFEINIQQEATETDQVEYVTLKVRKKIMQCDQITSAVDRLKLSHNQTSMIITASIKAAVGNLDNFDISRSTTRRTRMFNRQKMAEIVVETVKQNSPQYGALHWDGKRLKDMLGDT